MNEEAREALIAMIIESAREYAGRSHDLGMEVVRLESGAHTLQEFMTAVAGMRGARIAFENTLDALFPAAVAE